ncbi:putative transposase [Orientia tsutsugamushi str. Gilliam]|uniref:Putative transposase n=1 Tax=Orientia tsutsugamushi str. Gilliam TaxID=1359184 RepID=A0A0F3MAY1_ORITS|nr:putative transposase [Orientia tsutsugamushi str. Gilliam]
MKLDQIKELKDEKFRRLTGVRKENNLQRCGYFEGKLMALRNQKVTYKIKLNLEEQLLMVLEYLVGFIYFTGNRTFFYCYVLTYFL